MARKQKPKILHSGLVIPYLLLFVVLVAIFMPLMFARAPGLSL
ncbi:hypothetical protein QKT49_gp243 [Acanthamoeba castellanii medusavirus]|uniref:Uncharacterized protein n=1 Tax=Acanthamoeba castellanii medusavirus J1 TaxID=3114988 RepID=A0A3T1CXF7_9VIRU|nr:hypothetical protein QKT49_gp243 [Acanthamoeba castellanii medusavirus]BBI30520.1 hypothetical protein [Acanthamoeba castellanii medusavirus J1]